jgi:hypothetical protein
MLPSIPNLPSADKPWAKPVAKIVVLVTIIGLPCLAYFFKAHNTLHISEIVGLFLLFLAIVPPNLAVIYPWLLPQKHLPHNGTHPTAR